MSRWTAKRKEKKAIKHKTHDHASRGARLLALADDGRPGHDSGRAQKLAALGCPVFACTPDQFPDLMAHALGRHDLAQWAASGDIALVRPG